MTDFLRPLFGFERIVHVSHETTGDTTSTRTVDTSTWTWERWRPWWAVWRRHG